jgi:hypothetical protein
VVAGATALPAAVGVILGAARCRSDALSVAGHHGGGNTTGYFS